MTTLHALRAPMLLLAAMSFTACSSEAHFTHYDAGAPPQACATSTCIATGLASAGLVTVDAASVYWITGDSLMKAPLVGGAPVVVSAIADGIPSFALDGTNAYWADVDQRAVMKVPLTGGTPAMLAPDDFAVGMAADGTRVYWSSWSTAGPSAPSSIHAVPVAGGPPVKLADVDVKEFPTLIAIGATDLYFASTGGLMKIPIVGGAVSDLTPGLVPRVFAVYADQIYFPVDGAGSSSATIMAVPVAGGALTTLASGLPQPAAVAADATGVYWIDSLDGSVMVVPIGGGAPKTLAKLHAPTSVAVDATSVYVTASGDQPDQGALVLRIAK